MTEGRLRTADRSEHATRRAAFAGLSANQRWMAVIAITSIAGIVALWPRSTPEPPPPPTDTVPVQEHRGPQYEAEDPGVLAPLREQAQLAPCPAPGPDSSAPQSGPLSGVVVPCLGAPGTVDLGAALAGRVTLINVWASWCGVCREEMPVISSYAAQPGSIPVLGVSIQDRASSALALAAELGISYPNTYDPADALRRALATPSYLPVNYLVHPDGSVEQITSPHVFGEPEQIQAAIDDLLRRHR